ncbi:MAG: carboxy terminal-processing peptidase, partial [Deltaproteobacteria bacterium]|nr:carboxy terminal-processing peptidase [Deltaproteobacteria bacterium]
ELRERAVDVYIERIDPSKTLFLSDEVKELRAQLRGVFFGLQNDECEMLDGLQTDIVRRYERMEEEVRAFVSDPAYALDTEVVLILDPEKRGHPQDDEARRRLVERLVHFQMSNYLESDMELDKAKEKLVHRYELMTKRAGELESRDIYGNFLNAFAGALDPHSTYYPPEAVEDFEIQMSLSLDGIGVALSSKDGYSIVERIIPGGATDKAKLLEPGDKIIAVAQEGEEPVDIIDMSLRDVVAMIRGKRGTTVNLTVLRKGETTERLEVAIVRDKVTIEDAAATLEFREVEIGGKPRKLAILDLPTFYGDPDPSKRQSGRDVRDLLRQIKEAKADGVLLDLSRNGGGKLESSVQIAGLFIPQGGVVAVKNVFSEVQVLEDPDEDLVYDGPLVILTSRITASASEIVAGALKDYDRAVIVGDDHTFGKGTVQSFVHQPGSLGAIKVTTALFFRPGGASTQHSGVAADVVLPSLFATDDLGEQYTPYSLKSQEIPAFLEPTFQRVSKDSPAWRPITPELLGELSRRSEARVTESEEFAEIQEQLAKLAEEEDVLRLADLIEERREAEKTDGAESDDAAQPGPADDEEAEAKPESDASEDEAGAPSDEGETDEQASAEADDSEDEEESEPSIQEEEALRVLADLIELQETAQASWLAPQSASRSEPSSSPQ